LKRVFILVFFALSYIINAQENDGNINKEAEQSVKENIDYDKTGIILSLSAFNYFSMGLGFNKGNWGRAGPHFFGSNYGVLIEYKTIKEMHLRVYGNIYGGVSAMYLGLSGILCTNLEEMTAGMSPEIGLGFSGGSIFYRYNFYLNNNYNCHEIVLLIYPLNKIFKRNGRKK
jgi:hypothetical protein